MNSRKRKRIVTTMLAMTIGLGVLAPDESHAATLQQLFDGNSIKTNNTVFFDWQLDPSSDASTGLEPDFTKIDVIPIQSSNTVGLRFNANDQWTTIGETFIDSFFSYSIATTIGSSSVIDSQLTLSSFKVDGVGGAINIIDELSDQNDNLIALNDVFVDNLSGDSDLVDRATFNGQLQLSVETSVLVFGDFDEDIVHLNTFEQSFTTSAVPLPSAAGLFIPGAITAFAATWQRNRSKVNHS